MMARVQYPFLNNNQTCTYICKFEGKIEFQILNGHPERRKKRVSEKAHMHVMA